MHWLLLLIAFACLVVALNTASLGLAVLCLLLAGGLTIAWLLTLLAQRVEGAARSEVQILSPDELRKLRDRTEAAREEDPGTDPTRQ